MADDVTATAKTTTPKTTTPKTTTPKTVAKSTTTATTATTTKSSATSASQGRGYASWTKSDLLDRAQELDIEGRTTMKKNELIKALRAAN
ncbi:MAG: Rho termination factor N-terminal domain-containing protein [Acidimicrobiia bacterium]|nr:Rho termination factor N-terminal domain-containing protein [Acidimicrobiia bacterium]